jgi:glucose-1-phosphate adenylyltransferase
MVRQGQAVAHPFDLSCVGTQPGPAALLARRGHDRRLLGRQHRPHRHRPELNLYDQNWPIWTYQPQLPPAKFVHNQISR